MVGFVSGRATSVKTVPSEVSEQPKVYQKVSEIFFYKVTFTLNSIDCIMFS